MSVIDSWRDSMAPIVQILRLINYGAFQCPRGFQCPRKRSEVVKSVINKIGFIDPIVDMLFEISQGALLDNEIAKSVINDIGLIVPDLTFNGCASQFYSHQITNVAKNNSKFMLALVTEDYCALQFASDKLKDDAKIVQAACNIIPYSPEKRVRLGSP